MKEVPNIACRIEAQADLRPTKTAIQFPLRARAGVMKYQALSFKEFEQSASHFALGLTHYGVKKGDRVLLFVRPSLDFPALVFALFKMGATPVLIDPGMGKENLLRAISDVKPRVLISEPVVHIMRKLYPASFKGIELFFTTKFFGGISFKKLKAKTGEFKAVTVSEDDLAAILFTSGGTGAPKGVMYTHSIFNAQTDRLAEMFSLTSEDVDVPGFPLFAFFTLAVGMTSVTPMMDPSKPAQCDPAKIVQNIKDHQATFVAGSPAIWERVADYCCENNIILESVGRVVMFGAPVRYELHEKFEKILPNGTTYTPYGATECLPVANVSGKDVLQFGKSAAINGGGTYLGAPAPKAKILVIKVTDDEIPTLADAHILPPGAVGEIIVKSDVVTPGYFEKHEATKLAKICEEKELWHRMGDMGRMDSAGNLWFLGRKSHRVENRNGLTTSIDFESVFNHQLALKRSALIALGPSRELALVVEGVESPELTQKIFDLARKYDHTKNLTRIFYKEQFPVDVRHNIKIDRLALAREFNQENL